MQDKRKTVLVIDDQDDERAIQRAMLGHVGYHVREASSGVSGLEAVAEAAPDLILLDVAMPRMDGFEVCRSLRADPRTAEIPVLFFTASVVGDLQAQITAAGGNGVIVKPMDPNLVAEEIQRIIGPP
jgi:CheY-like chemotaxis protein